MRICLNSCLNTISGEKECLKFLKGKNNGKYTETKLPIDGGKSILPCFLYGKVIYWKQRKFHSREETKC